MTALLLQHQLLLMLPSPQDSVKYISYYTYGPQTVATYPPIHNASCECTRAHARPA